MHRPTDHRPNGPYFIDRATGVRIHPREFPLAAGLIAEPARRVARANRERLRAGEDLR